MALISRATDKTCGGRGLLLLVVRVSSIWYLDISLIELPNFV